MSQESILAIDDLRVAYARNNQMVDAVSGVGFKLGPAETLGIVGESGSGKSTIALSIPRLVHLSGGRIVAGSVQVDGEEVVSAPDQAMRRLRGRSIGMVFQQPLSSLNPVLSIGQQLTEGIRIHLGYSATEARDYAVQSLREVRLPDPIEAMDRFPHELSGGMRQRVVIAMAIVRRPKLLIADEPTTALDVTIQAQILELLRIEAERLRLATLFISHDIAVVASIADRIGVMYAGELVEIGPAKAVVQTPAHPYTWGLLRAVPKLGHRDRLQAISGSTPALGHRFVGCRFVDRCPFRTAECFTDAPPLAQVASGHVAACWHADDFKNIVVARADARSEVSEPIDRQHGPGKADPNADALVTVRGLSKHYRVRTEAGWRVLKAVDSVDLQIKRGEVLGLVGESGCGKSTLARLIIRLIDPTSGDVIFKGKSLLQESRSELRKLRSAFQIIFQNPSGALNPRSTIEDIVDAPLRVQQHARRGDRSYHRELLETVGLDESYLERFPHQLSGGQKQRVSIARALALRPEFLVCDEAVSALDVSTQAQVMNLLSDLKARLGLTYVFISHDMAAVQSLCDRVAVMYLGRIVEMGTVEQIFENPEHPYTRTLLSAVPSLDFVAKPREVGNTEPPSPVSPPSGCCFHPRCNFCSDICRTVEPDVRELGRGRSIACHHAPLGNPVFFEGREDVTGRR
jgi:peptide/nickel transport system ATP-binding protein